MEWPGWALSAWQAADPYVQKLALWRGYEAELQSLLIYAFGIAIYTMLVFGFFCNNVSRRDAFRLFKERPGWSGRLLRATESSLLFPAMSFLFFGVLAASLFLLAKPTQSTGLILILSMSVVVSVRVTAFVSETAAFNLAMLLPLSLLGVLLVDPTYASLANTWARFKDLPGLAPVLGRYFVLFLLLEGALHLARRVARGTQHQWKGHRERTLHKRDLLKQVRADHAASSPKTVTLTPVGPEPAREGPGILPGADETPFETAR
jgi:hypothetical protein